MNDSVSLRLMAGEKQSYVKKSERTREIIEDLVIEDLASDSR